MRKLLLLILLTAVLLATTGSAPRNTPRLRFWKMYLPVIARSVDNEFSGPPTPD